MCQAYCNYDILQHAIVNCNTLSIYRQNARDSSTPIWSSSYVICARCIAAATHCNSLQHTIAHCNTPQHTAHCNKTHVTHLPTLIELLHHIRQVFCNSNILQLTATHCNSLQLTATHCNSLQLTATHQSTQQYAAAHCSKMHVMHPSPSWTSPCTKYARCFETAFHCNTLWHAATHCNTL